MFSIFPCFWNLPRRKPIKSLANHHFHQQPVTVKISRPVPLSVPKPVPAPATPKIPVEEMCLGEDNDFSEIDKMLAEMENPSRESRAGQILQMIQTINEHLEKNIKVLQNTSVVDGDTVSRDDLLKLLQMFASYSHTLENYFKETKPSLP